MTEETSKTFTPAEMKSVMKTTDIVWDWIKQHLTEEERSGPPFGITQKLDQVVAKQVKKYKEMYEMQSKLVTHYTLENIKLEEEDQEIFNPNSQPENK